MTAEQPAPGYYAKVNIRDGVPLCPCHAEVMTEVGDDQWMCATGAATLAWIRARLEAITDA